MDYTCCQLFLKVWSTQLKLYVQGCIFCLAMYGILGYFGYKIGLEGSRGDFFEIFLVSPKRPPLGGPKTPYGSLCARKRLGVLTKKPQKTHFLAIK